MAGRGSRRTGADYEDDHGDRRHQREGPGGEAGIRGKDLIATLLMKGVFVTVNQSLDGELVKEVAPQFGADAKVISVEDQLENEAIEGFLDDTIPDGGDYAAAGGDGDGPRRSRQDVACWTRSGRRMWRAAKRAGSRSTSARTR